MFQSLLMLFLGCASNEIALKAIGTYLNVQLPTNSNWGTWLNAIRKKREDENRKAKWGKWAENDFSQDVYQRLDAIKDADRNPTMHAGSAYTAEGAKEIFELTRGFMEKIASKMDEDGEPLTSKISNDDLRFDR